MAEKVHYTYLDITRYLNRQMTAAEMHGFEKAMLEDPFLADAFEGYSDSDPETSLSHLKQIAIDIRGEKEEARVIMMRQTERGWWKIAAMVLVLTGIAFIGYRLTNSPSVQKQVAAVNPSPAPPPEADSFKADLWAENKKITPSKTPVARHAPAAQNKVQPPFVKQQPADEQIMASTITINADSLSTAAAADKMNVAKNYNTNALTKSAAQPRAMDTILVGKASGLNTSSQRKAFTTPRQVVIHGKVTDEQGEPVEFATVKGDDRAIQAITNSKGEFNLSAGDSSLNVSISATGFRESKTNVRAGASNNLALHEKEQSLSEVVVTGYGRQDNFRKSKAELADDQQNVTPVKGWKNFRKYEKQQVEKYIDDADEFTSGNVELEFTVAPNGSATNIKVVNQADKHNSAHAVKLLQKGPKWTSKTPGAKAVITIHY